MTVRRLMKERGLLRQKWRQRRGNEEINDHSREIFEARETRSFESEYVLGLWHLDFHAAKVVRIVLASGACVTPKLLGILDDRSRLCCHAQWYLDETAESLVHGLSQAIQKRRRPQQLMSDNGAAMTADEVREGLARLGILHERTLPACPDLLGSLESLKIQRIGRRGRASRIRPGSARTDSAPAERRSPVPSLSTSPSSRARPVGSRHLSPEPPRLRGFDESGTPSPEPKWAVDKVDKPLDKLDTDELDEHVKNAQAMIARGEEPKADCGWAQNAPDRVLERRVGQREDQARLQRQGRVGRLQGALGEGMPRLVTPITSG